MAGDGVAGLRVVTGPPCGGKSTLVQERREAGEVVVDYDLIAGALGSDEPHDAPEQIRDAAFAARAAAIDHVLVAGVDAWVIHTTPQPELVERYEQAGAEFIVCDPGIDECLRRAETDGRPERSINAIHQYYEPAEPKKRSQRMKIKNVQIDPKRVKAGPDDGLAEGEFIVYPSTFTREPDTCGDVVAKGAFARTISEWKASGDVMPGLYGHRMDDPDYFVAGAIDMGEDDHGWWIHGFFDLDSPKGPQTYRLVKGRRLRQLSFAYETIDESKVTLEDGRKANELRDLDVFEFSFVPVGANQDTSVVAIKALTDGIKAGRVLSAKNEQSLRDARDSIDSVLKSLGDVQDGKAADAASNDQEQASGTPKAKSDASDEEPAVAKSSVSDEELKAGPSVEDLAAQATIYALKGQEGVLS